MPSSDTGAAAGGLAVVATCALRVTAGAGSTLATAFGAGLSAATEATTGKGTGAGAGAGAIAFATGCSGSVGGAVKDGLGSEAAGAIAATSDSDGDAGATLSGWGTGLTESRYHQLKAPVRVKAALMATKPRVTMRWRDTEIASDAALCASPWARDAPGTNSVAAATDWRLSKSRSILLMTLTIGSPRYSSLSRRDDEAPRQRWVQRFHHEGEPLTPGVSKAAICTWAKVTRCTSSP